MQTCWKLYFVNFSLFFKHYKWDTKFKKGQVHLHKYFRRILNTIIVGIYNHKEHFSLFTIVNNFINESQSKRMGERQG